MGRGSELEALVRESAKRFEDDGLWIEQVGPRFIPSGPIGPRGEATGRVLGRGALDFIGDLRGRALTFDAKQTRQALRFDLDLVESHQVVLARKAAARGVIAFFLVELAAGSLLNRFFAVPARVLCPRWKAWDNARTAPAWVEKKPASIPLAVLEAEAVEVHLVKRSKALDLLRMLEDLRARATA